MGYDEDQGCNNESIKVVLINYYYYIDFLKVVYVNISGVWEGSVL